MLLAFGVEHIRLQTDRMKPQKIGNILVEAVEAKNGLVYFSARNAKGQAIWMPQSQEWKKCHGEFAPRFKMLIAQKFNLINK